jgi:hypothetical protein
MSNSDNQGLTVTHSASSTFKFCSLNNSSENDGSVLKIYGSFYKYNFVMFILTYLLYSSLPDGLINLVTLVSVYFIMAKGGNVLYRFINDSNYSFIDSFQQDCIINLNIIFNGHDNDNFNKQLSYVLDMYPFPPMYLRLLSQLFNTLVLFAVHFIDLFIFFRLGFLPIISLPFAGCMITHYCNTSTVETVENMILRGDSEEDSEETEEDNEERNEELNYEKKLYNEKDYKNENENEKGYENDVNYYNTNEIEPKKQI